MHIFMCILTSFILQNTPTRTRKDLAEVGFARCNFYVSDNFVCSFTLVFICLNIYVGYYAGNMWMSVPTYTGETIDTLCRNITRIGWIVEIGRRMQDPRSFLDVIQ